MGVLPHFTTGTEQEKGSGALTRSGRMGIITSPYISWEQYFTDLLVRLTKDTVLHYSKQRLNPVYLQDGNVAKILSAMALSDNNEPGTDKKKH